MKSWRVRSYRFEDDGRCSLDVLRKQDNIRPQVFNVSPGRYAISVSD